MLWLIQRVFFGPVMEGFNGVKDVSRLEVFYCWLLIAVIFVIGVFPTALTGVIETSFDNILRLLGG
jgi:NADH:ubiquinone oxidoreductase subunit 4 (subunit M)